VVCQIPEKSGLPLAKRGIFWSAFAVAAAGADFLPAACTGVVASIMMELSNSKLILKPLL
jgi:uncharacterized membrane protein